jgi:5-formyltetrahydrofolate cyclo-ligase
LARHGIQVLGERNFRAVSGYWPMRSEMDLRPLLIALANTGREVALPAVTGFGRPLEFRRWRPGMAMAEGRFGTQHPPQDAKPIEPDVLLVPLLAFDRRYFRLGYGAGFYDRTLAALRTRKTVLAIGVGFAAQLVDAVPVNAWDQRLDLVLTEQGIL